MSDWSSGSVGSNGALVRGLNFSTPNNANASAALFETTIINDC